MATKIHVNRHSTQKYSVYNRETSEQTIALPKEFVGINPMMDVSYKIIFTVNDFDGEPITGATVKCGTLSVTNKGGGVYEVLNVPEGNHSYIISRSGYVSVEGTVEVVDRDVYIDVDLCQPPTITSSSNLSFETGQTINTQLEYTGTKSGCVWSYTGVLPMGVSFSSSGKITGSPIEGGEFNIVAKVKNDCGENTKNLKINVCAIPKIEINEIVIPFNVPVSEQLEFKGTQAGIKWSVSSGSLPSGLVLNENGILNGKATTFGITNVTLKVMNTCGLATKEVKITVCADPNIISNDDTGSTFTIDTYGQYQLVNSGTPGEWSVVNGSLPPTLSLNPETGLISGTPRKWGYFECTVQVSGPCGSATQLLKMFICKYPTIVTTEIDIVSGDPMLIQLEFQGSPGTWTVFDGTLPDGLTLSSSGVISGTTNFFGDYDFTVKLENTCGSAIQRYFDSVCGKPSIKTDSKLEAVKEEVCEIQLESNGSPGWWSMEDGYELPDGLVLGADGVISGTPTVSGNYNFTVKVENDCGSATKPMNMVICGKPVITTNEINFTSGEEITEKLKFKGSMPGKWSVSEETPLPSGITLSTNGTLSGITTESGEFEVKFRVENNCGYDEKTIVVFACSKPNILSGWVINFPLNEEFEYQLTHEGSPGKWSMVDGNLPDGVELGEDGVLFGTATESGYFAFTLKVENFCGEVEKALDMFVCELPEIKVDDMVLLQNIPFNKQLMFSGSRSGKWEVVSGSLPLGLELSKSGLLSGTPWHHGNFNFTLSVTNPCGVDTKPINIKVERAFDVIFTVKGCDLNLIEDAIINVGTCPIVNNEDGTYKAKMPQGTNNYSVSRTGFATYNGTVVVNLADVNVTVVLCELPSIVDESVSFVKGVVESVTLDFAGCKPGIWSIAGGSLPSGITLSSSGVLGGNTSQSGKFTFTAKVENDCGVDTQEIEINICAKPIITTDNYLLFEKNEDTEFQLTYTGSEGKWEIANGSLPDGLVLTEDGIIKGKSTVDGTFTAIFKLTNDCGSVSKTITMLSCMLPRITSEANINFEIGVSKSQQLTHKGTDGSWSIDSGILPEGLSLSSSGIISGTPLESGNFSLTLKVENPCGSVTQNVNVFVCAHPVITSGNIEFLQSTPVSEQLHFTGSRPGKWSVVSGAFPTGITLSKSGLISGVTAQYGEFIVTIRVENPCGFDEKEISVYTCATPFITCDNSIDFTIGEYDSVELTYTGIRGEWTIISGELPDGVDFDEENGVISGTPTVSGSYYFVAKIVNVCGEATKKFSLHVCQIPKISSEDFSFIQGVAVNETLKYVGSRPGTWEIVSGSLPVGLTLNKKTGVISGTTHQSGNFMVTIKVENLCGSDEKTIGVLTCSKPVIINSNVSFVLNTYGEDELEVIGTQVTWSIDSGNLPEGLELDAETGIIKGTPVASGTFTFKVKAENICGADVKSVYIHICSLPVILTDNISYTLGTTVSKTLAFSGTRPGTWTITSGSLPTGLSLNTATGVISGTPTEFGDFPITIMVTNSCGSVEKDIVIGGCATPSILCCCDMDFIMGEFGTAQMQSTGSAGIWSVSEGALPGGLTLDVNTGVISGIPTVSGSFTFKLKLVNDCGEATQTINMFICNRPNILTTGDMPFQLGVPVTKEMKFSGSRPGTWTIENGSLPTGLTLDSETGVISGTPTVKGDFTFTIKVKNPCGENEKIFNSSVCDAPVITTTIVGTIPLTTGSLYSLKLNATGSPGVWTVDSGAMPKNLVLNPNTGMISGTVIESGNFSFVVKLENSCGEDTIDINMSVCGKPSLTSGWSITFIVDQLNTYQLTNGGSAVTWSIVGGSLPPGVSLNPTTGIISGVPSLGGHFIFILKLANDCGTVIEELDLYVEGSSTCVPPVITSSSVEFTMNKSESKQLLATGSTGTWSLESGSLPDGLLLSTTGAISGKPLECGDFIITVKITNSCGDDEKSITITVHDCILPDIEPEEINFVVDEVGSYTIPFTGSTPVTFSIVPMAGEKLPANMILSSSGVISGKPIEYGTFKITVKISNACGDKTEKITINVIECEEAVIITDEMFFELNVEDSKQIIFNGSNGVWTIVGSETGGSFDLSFDDSFETGSSSSGLPNGLDLDPDTGQIYGTPTEDGVFVIKVKITNDCSEVEKEITITVGGCVPPFITSGDMSFVKGAHDVKFLTASGDPGVWTITPGLPSGLGLIPGTNEVSGTPTVFGDFTVNVKVENDCGEDDKDIIIYICGSPEIQCENELSGSLGNYFELQLDFIGTPFNVVMP